MLKYKYILFGSFITPEMECQVEHIALWDTYCMMCTLNMLQIYCRNSGVLQNARYRLRLFKKALDKQHLLTV